MDPEGFEPSSLKKLMRRYYKLVQCFVLVLGLPLTASLISSLPFMSQLALLKTVGASPAEVYAYPDICVLGFAGCLI